MLLNVSAQRTTGGPAVRRARQRRNHACKVSGANGGEWRRVEIPPRTLSRSPNPGAFINAFTTSGINDPSGAQYGIRSIEYAARGRGRPA
jgi:hypothetical protein